MNGVCIVPILYNDSTKYEHIGEIEANDLPSEEEKPQEKDEPTVLILYNASPSLIEHEFRRIVPRGKHIKEWRGAGNIEKGV